MRILAVDDDQNVLDLLEVILSVNKNCILDLFTSPVEALRALNGRIRKFDCIILDIVMPDMDGITLCKKILAIPRYQDTPVIMLTRKSDQTSIMSAFAAGATDYLTKPFEIHEVAARIRLAGELSATRNEIRALRRRARLEKRNAKIMLPENSSVDRIAIEKPRSSKKIVTTNKPYPDKASEFTNNISRDEIVQLFSKDFLDHAYLHRRQSMKRAHFS